MANFLVAIGGTGQMAALAYVRLAKLCGFQPARIYLLDRDIAGPLSEKLEEVSGQGKLPAISPIRPDERTFREIFGRPPTNKVASVLSVLFSEEQLETEIRDGMYSRPSVGSTAFMAKIVLGSQEDQQLQRLIQLLNGRGHRVVICGSVMGGTGAGGVPTLAKYIRQKMTNDHIPAHANFITIIDFIKWFKIDDDGINRQLDRNAQSGIFYLKDTIAQFVDACVLLGMDNPDDKMEPNRKIGEQEEIKHFINLIAASIIANTFHIHEYQKLFETPNEPYMPHEVYGYNIPDHGLRPADIKIYLPDDTTPNAPSIVSLKDIIMLARGTAAYLGAFAQYFQDGPPKTFLIPRDVAIPSSLQQAFERLPGGKRDEHALWNNVKVEFLDRQKALNDSLSGWFDSLKLPEYFAFDAQETDLSGKDYTRDTKPGTAPVAFFKGVLDEIALKNWQSRIEQRDVSGFVDEIEIALRKKLNALYFERRFGEMTWLKEPLA